MPVSFLKAREKAKGSDIHRKLQYLQGDIRNGQEISGSDDFGRGQESLWGSTQMFFGKVRKDDCG